MGSDAPKKLEVTLPELIDVLRQQPHADDIVVHQPVAPTARIRSLALCLDNRSIVSDVDAVLVHRYRDGDQSGAGAWISWHDGFHASYGIGLSTDMASTLGMSDVEVLKNDKDIPIGLIGIVNSTMPHIMALTDTVFGGHESTLNISTGSVHKIALVGAMDEYLVRKAKSYGTSLYITGQMRKPGIAALMNSSMGAIAIGHRRSERWGMIQLGIALQKHFLKLRIMLGSY